ncbi:MAG: MlaD family protein [Planctomycetota bacterium]|jgi:ABC-type transporter Mla subunit MlaD
MRARTQHLLVGSFVFLGMALGLAAVIALGSGIWKESLDCETYFEESVQGLEKGSEVRFRGVKIGEVVNITLSNNKYDTEEQLVVVEFALNPPEGLELEEYRARILRNMRNGLHLRLAPQGITGTLYMEADLKPDLGAPFPGLEHEDWATDRLYIPSDTSTIQRLSTSLNSVMDDLGRARLTDTVDEIRKTVAAFRVEVEAMQLGELSQNISELVTKGNQLLPQLEEDARRISNSAERSFAKFDQLTEDVRGELRDGSIRQAIENFDKTLAEFRVTGSKAQETLDELRGSMRGKGRDLSEILADLRQLTSHLARLSSTLERYPSWLLLGQPPPVRSPGK